MAFFGRLFGKRGGNDIVDAIELHSVEQIQAALDGGLNPNTPIRAKSEWETTIFDVTPVSYAQFGLLPQVHRREGDIYDNIRLLLEASGRTLPPLENVPNRYLKPKAA